jgi:hypothetical protein
MFQNHFIKLISVLLFCQIITSKASSQVRYAFARDTIGIKGGETFVNMLKVSNGYAQKVVLKNTAAMIKGMIELPDTMVLQAGESKTFPLKYIADRQTIKSNIQVFTVHLIAEQAGLDVQASARFITVLKNVGGLTIGTETDEVYLSQLHNQAQVMIRCSNNGYVPVTFRLLLSGIPEGLEFIGQTMNLTLQPGAQQLLPFLARNKSTGRTTPDFTVTIQALDDQNNQLTAKLIRVVNVSSARSMRNGSSQFEGNQPNSVSLRYGSLSNSTTLYQMQGNGSRNLGNDKHLNYQINIDQYRQKDYNGVNIFNTYIDYQTKYWGIKLGNIYEDLDLQLGGRGIKASARLRNKGVLSFYGVDNNYLLYDQLNTKVPAAKIVAIDYSFANSLSEEQRVTVMRRHDPFTGLDANQLSLKKGFILNDGQTLRFEGGYSTEKQYKGDAGAKPGGSIGLIYVLEREKYRINVNSYYGSPYYTGLRRGLFSTNARISYQLAKTSNLVARISVQESDVKYQAVITNEYNLLNLGINKSALHLYELGYNQNIGSFTLSLAPYYLGQRLISSTPDTVSFTKNDWKSSSARLNASLNYSGRLQSFSLSADYGYTYLNTSEKPPAPFHSLKLNASYTLPILGFNGFAQFNPYYLADALFFRNGNAYSLYSFGPNVHFSAIKDKLRLQFSGNYNYYGFTRNTNYTASGSVRYLMKNNWSFTADMQYTVTRQALIQPFESLETVTPVNYPTDLIYNNRQIRAGIEKRFGNSSKGSKKLSLLYYEDHNSNGIRDAGEGVVPGVLVKINGEAALTNSKGMVEFKEMKKDKYTASVTNTKGWSLQDPTDVFLDKNKSIEVALVKTQALNGCIKLIGTKYMDGRPSLAGIRINAVDVNGRIEKTLTDDHGEFCFYLPRNKYTIYIETEGMPFSIVNGKEEVLLAGKPVELLTFLYKDERRKIGVTRF